MSTDVARNGMDRAAGGSAGPRAARGTAGTAAAAATPIAEETIIRQLREIGGDAIEPELGSLAIRRAAYADERRHGATEPARNVETTRATGGVYR